MMQFLQFGYCQDGHPVAWHEDTLVRNQAKMMKKQITKSRSRCMFLIGFFIWFRIGKQVYQCRKQQISRSTHELVYLPLNIDQASSPEVPGAVAGGGGLPRA